MRFKHLHIENIRSYQNLDLVFEDGVTVISGVNGSGKSSILEACFMGLFGGKVLTDTKLNIPDMIRKGSSHAKIALDFEHAGDNYRIEHHFKVQKTNVKTDSILFKNGENIAEQTTKTYETLVGLLNMDEKNFQNCAYIRQGDVDALINARPAERQEMIDDLLRLGKLEDYRQRSRDSKTAVSRVLKIEQEAQKKLQKQIEELQSKNLYDECGRFREMQKKIDGALQNKRQEMTEAEKTLILLDSKIKEIEKAEKEIGTLKQNILDLEKKYDADTVEKEKSIRQISDTEKNIEQNEQAFKLLLSELTRSGRSIENNGDGKETDMFLIQAREEEKKAVEEKHALSSKLNLIAADKKNKEKNTDEKETEQKTLFETLAGLETALYDLDKKIDAADTAVKDGYLKAKNDKNAFMSVFEDVVSRLNSEQNDAKDMSGLETIWRETVVLADVVKAAELPLPSNEENWNTAVSDIENLENGLLREIQKRETKLTETQTTKAKIIGEQEEKKKSIEEAEKEIREIEEEKEKRADDLKREQAELEKIIKKTADLRFLLNAETGKRAKNIVLCPVFEKTVPAARYELADILPEDAKNAAEFLAAEKEKLIKETSGLETAEKSVQSIIAKKEELLKAGKCPTCGQEIKADGLHPEHKTEDELRQLADIKNRRKTAENEKILLDNQIKIMKEILGADQNIEKLNGEIGKSESEEKGKRDLIAGYHTNLKENEERKGQKNARLLELKISCDASRKDLENISRRLDILNAEKAEKAVKTDLLSRHKKTFSDTVNTILKQHTILENEKKNKNETQKRIDETAESKQKLQKILDDLASDTLEILKSEDETKAQERTALEKVAAAQSLLSKAEKLSDLKRKRDELKKSRLDQTETLKLRTDALDALNNQIVEKTRQRKELETQISAPDNKTFEEQKKSAASEIKSLNDDISDMEEKKTHVTQKIGSIKTDLESLKKYKDDSAVLRNKILFISLVYDDVAMLEDMYVRIRADMRSKNIEMLDRLLNDMFDFIYTNNAYSHLELDADYNLKVHEKDGSVLEPKQLSGGERAIFNLALRCAIYRLLSYGFGENNAGRTSLPPLIFDEPTVFLDSGHVRQLIKLIEHMKEDGVGQIIVVSHDESLIDSADRNYRIIKDPVTNASEKIV